MAAADGPNTLAGVARLYFGHVSTRIILASGVPLIMARLYLGQWRAQDALILVVAIIAWPFFEWVFHLAIHLRPLRIGGHVLDSLPAREHRLHHVHPPIVDHILLPPITIVFLAIGSIVGFWLLLGPRLGTTAAICFHLGGLANGWVHLLTHTRYPPKGRYFKWLRRTHFLHHFKNESYWFGFTGPFVDVLFGTHRDPATVETSQACSARRRHR